MIPV